MSTRHTSRTARRLKQLPASRVGPRPAPGRKKQRLTFTLSSEAVEHIRSLRAKADSPSLSATVERLIESNRRAQRHADLQNSIAAYYDSLSPAEMNEDEAWGAAGEAALAPETPSPRKRVGRTKRRAS